ncbi:MAG: retropepsin-like aspartic protease [Holophaga sp.]|nr:retropepsin-like aspartic protease [Holophaga sp.]
MFPARSLSLVLVAGLGLQAQAPFDGRIAEIEQVLNRHFRGPRADEARERSNQEIEAFNGRSKRANAELAEARAKMEQATAPGRTAFAELTKLDAELKASIPDGADKPGNAKYAVRIDARNAFAGKVNALNEAGQRAIAEFNALAAKTKAELDNERTQIMANQEAINLRVQDFEKFVKSGEDIAFFVRVNRLLAEVRTALRKAEGPELTASLSKVRAIRRELGQWAIAGQSLNPKGLIVVEAQVQDEPCWLIVDTGATETILSQEIADAIGLGGAQAESVSLIVVGGLRLQGRHFTIPKLTTLGQTLANVSAAAVRPADVGIDGLLGQSFLKSFSYTIDKRKPEKLFLIAN